MSFENKNGQLKDLIISLKKHSIEQKASFWKTIATELERPSRNHRVVNLGRIEKYCKDNDVVVVPGKLLSGGDLTKKVTIVAYAFSRKTADKLGSKIMSIEDAMKKYPNGKNLKIIG
jgi:large subunit ribosomal protein L18e